MCGAWLIDKYLTKLHQQMPLYIEGRPKDYKIVLNSATPKKDKLQWGKETYLPWGSSFVVGDSFVIVVSIEQNFFRFKVS